MKKIGLLGGMSWESTVTYYQLINEYVKEALGGFNSAELILYSVNFAIIEEMQHQGKWQEAGDILVAAAKSLQAAGADCLVLCTNTMHMLAPQITSQVTLPLLHIADATAEAVLMRGIKKVALLGTKFTMEEDFYVANMRKHGVEAIVPDKKGRQVVHDIIYQELCLGKIDPNSRKNMLAIIAELVNNGAEGVVLGCTEIGLLIQQQHLAIPVLDSTTIHAAYAVNYALNQ